MAGRESPYDWLVTLVRPVICVANLIYIFDLIKFFEPEVPKLYGYPPPPIFHCYRSACGIYLVRVLIKMMS